MNEYVKKAKSDVKMAKSILNEIYCCLKEDLLINNKIFGAEEFDNIIEELNECIRSLNSNSLLVKKSGE